MLRAAADNALVAFHAVIARYPELVITLRHQARMIAGSPAHNAIVDAELER